jgi:2-haloacid dehalogenase
MTARVTAVFFDLYGTLLDLAPLSVACEAVAPGRGDAFARAWRAEQLRLTWLRTVMGAWADFETVTADALSWTAGAMVVDPSVASGALANAFDELPLRPEARPVLDGLRASGLTLGVLSNGSTAMLVQALGAAGLPDTFDHVLSVDAVRSYKPDPAVYALAVKATDRSPESIGFVTANDWDAAGAATFGLRVAWLRPAGAIEPPRVGAPAPTIATWTDLPKLFAG